MKRIIYLAGPISGPLLPENRQRFHEVEERVSTKWFGCAEKVVLNPATLPLGLREQDYMAISMQMLFAADTVVMLNGWEQSTGARIEFEQAKKCGKYVFSESTCLMYGPPTGDQIVPEDWQLARD